MERNHGTVLITGAGKRIGRGIALCFARAGWCVIAHYNHSREDAQSLLAEMGGESAGHSTVQMDFSDLSGVSSLIPCLISRGTVPTCVINSASVYSRIRLIDATPEEMSRVFAVNFSAPYELMRSFAEHVSCGNVINITDQRVSFVDPAAGPYGLAKKALSDATEAAALDWAPRIRVNAVAPGIVLPPPGVPWGKMEALLPKIPMKHRSTEEEIASACLFLAASESITGQTIYVDGGLHLLGHPIETKNPGA